MKKTLVLALLMSVAFVSSSFAAVSFSSRTGDIKVTMPDGKVVIVKADQALPNNIPDGASIEVISGTAQISVTGHSKVNMVFSGMKAALVAGDSVKLSIDTEKGSGIFSVTSGSVNVIKPDGSTLAMNKSSKPLEFKAEAYSHHSSNYDTKFMERRIEREESSRDISSIR